MIIMNNIGTIKKLVENWFCYFILREKNKPVISTFIVSKSFIQLIAFLDVSRWLVQNLLGFPWLTK